MIIVPGQLVSDKPQQGEGVFVEGGKTYASTLGILIEGRVIPLKGQYLPIPGDYVVGVISEERFSGYNVEVHSPYEGSLSNKEVRESFKMGDVISAKVIDVNEIHEPILAEARLLKGGEVIEIEPVKVPRVIGRNGSMLSVLKEHTKSELFVGKNGRIYLRGGDTALATLAILKICREAHTSGLTDRMAELLTAELKKRG